MFSKLKRGFTPNPILNSKNEFDNVRYETVKLSAAISQEVRTFGEKSFQYADEPVIDNDDTKEAYDEEEVEEKEKEEEESTSPNRLNMKMNLAQLGSLSEIILTELLYYNQLSEIGCFLASAYSDEENQNNPSEHMSQLSANMLIASGRVRQKIMKMTEIFGISCTLLGPASYEYDADSIRELYTVLLKLVYTKLGGYDEQDKHNDESHVTLRREVLSKLCDLSESAWTIINLCGMMNAFRFRPSIGRSALFDTVQVTPSESVFGNNGWRPVLKAAKLLQPEFE